MAGLVGNQKRGGNGQFAANPVARPQASLKKASLRISSAPQDWYTPIYDQTCNGLEDNAAGHISQMRDTLIDVTDGKRGNVEDIHIRNLNRVRNSLPITETQYGEIRNWIADTSASLSGDVVDTLNQGADALDAIMRCGSCGQFTGNQDHTCSTTAAAEAVIADSEIKPVDDKIASAEQALLSAVDHMSTSKEFMEALRFQARIHNYSFSNSLLLMVEHARRKKDDPSLPADPGAFMSYKNWQGAERQVEKGEKGYPILVPMKRSFRYYINAAGERVYLKYKEKAPAGKDVTSGSYVKGFSLGHTFAQYQTDGKPVPEAPRPRLLKGESLPGLKEKVEDLITASGYTVHYVDPSDSILGGANGVTIPGQKVIAVRNDVDDFQRDKTLIHEFSHLRLHTSGDHVEIEHRGFAEVQAESTAYVVFSALSDMDTSDYSVAYISGWSTSIQGNHETRAREVRRALNGIGNTAREVIDAFTGAKDSVDEAA